jgi:hypothetical protein
MKIEKIAIIAKKNSNPEAFSAGVTAAVSSRLAGSETTGIAVGTVTPLTPLMAKLEK